MDKYLKSNRALWDEWTGINYRSDFYRVAEFKAGLNKLRPYEMAEIGPVDGKQLLHLQCHFGLDTLCWARLGAQSDIYELPHNLEGDFDIVYTSRGVLNWLPDLDRWGKVAAHFVRPGGFFYITEIHPIALVFDDDEGVRDLRLRYAYFNQPEPISVATKGSYADRNARVTQEVEYGWNHALGEIVTALTTAGLHIDFLHEFPFAEWPISFLRPAADGTHRLPTEDDGKLPLFFSLKASMSP